MQGLKRLGIHNLKEAQIASLMHILTKDYLNNKIIANDMSDAFSLLGVKKEVLNYHEE
jgi:hypothetical protein